MTELQSLQTDLARKLSANVCTAGADLDAISELLAELGLDKCEAEQPAEPLNLLDAHNAAERMRELAESLASAGNAIMGVSSVVLALVDQSSGQSVDELTRAFGAQQIKDFLNLDTWEATQGFGSIDTIICPHCKAEFSVNQFAHHEVSRFTCPACRKSATVRTVQTSQGRAWITDAEVADGGKAGGA